MKLFFSFLLFILPLSSIWGRGNYWTISVTPNGTYGGYIETTSGASQHDVAYSTTWPIEGYVPVFYVHFPKGSFSVTSENTGVMIDVRDMTSQQNLLTGASAAAFEFTAPQEGWYRFGLSGGTPDVTILKDFEVSSTSDISGNNTNVWLSAWRSAPSLHMAGWGSTNTQMPTGDAFDWAYHEVQMPLDADFYGTYIESMGGAGWYLGIQNNGGNGSTQRRTVIFAAWDNGDTEQDASLAAYKRSGIVAVGEADDVTADRFGGEGTGTHIMLNGPLWKPGQWVRFLLYSRPEQIHLNDGSTYNNTLLSAWYWAEGVDTEWHFIGTLRQAGYSHYADPTNAFLEEYTRANTSQDATPHKGYYRRAFTRSMESGVWYNRNSFLWSQTDSGVEDGNRNDTYQSVVDDYEGEPAICMQSGGYLYNEKIEGESTLPYRDPQGVVPDDGTLQTLLTRDIYPALQTQNEQRMQLAIDGTLAKLSNSGWSVVAYSSQEQYMEGTNGFASLAVDGDVSTYWHTSWAWGNVDYPHSITLLHDGEITLDQMALVLPTNRSTNYTAKKVTVSKSANGTAWTEVGTYTLDASSSQAIRFASPLTTTYLKLDFTEGNGLPNLVIGDIEFYHNDLNSMKTLAQSILDGVDKFNGYDSQDTQTALYLSILRTVLGLDAVTTDQLSNALVALAQNGKLLKCGEVTKNGSFSAEKAYYITNAYGYGALVAASSDAIYPTLRNASPVSGTSHENGCLEVYKQTARVQDALNNWRILRSEKYSEYYYIYNEGAGKYFNPAYQSGLSTTPSLISITRTNNGFLLSSISTNYNGHTLVCAAPQFSDDGHALSMWNNDNGNYWLIYENYAFDTDLTSAELAAMRQTTDTEAHKYSYASQGVVVTMKGQYATFSSSSDMDFTGIDGLNAYAATSYADGILQMTQVNAAPRFTGLVLHGDPGEYEVPFASFVPADITNNKLVAVTEHTTIAPTAGDAVNYLLVNGSQGIGFYPVSQSGTMAAGKAYLQLPASASYVNAFTLSFDSLATDIKAMQDVNCAKNEKIYNLAGQRLSKMQKGLNIVNRKKIIVQ